jgi:hypothetical protein
MGEPREPSYRVLIVGTVTFAAFVGLMWLVCAPNFIRSGTSKTNGIVNNLRRLDGAKQQWALEHHRTGATEVAREDIAEYVGVPPHKGWVQAVAGERYTLNLLTESPEAELTRAVDGRPKGTRFRLLPEGVRFSVSPLKETNWGLEIISPNTVAAPNAASPHR